MEQIGLIFKSYPDVAGYKKRDTSRDSAKEIESKAKTLRMKVLEYLGFEDLTADEIAKLLGESILSIRPRLSELALRGQVEPTSERRLNDSGKKAIVWRLKT